MTESEQARQQACIDAVGELAPRLLRTLSMLEFASRHLHPAALPTLAEQLAPLGEELTDAVTAFAEVDWPEPLHPVRDALSESATLAAGACSGLQLQRPEDFIEAFKALRRQVRALERLYALAFALPPVGRFFLERDLDDAVAAELLARFDTFAEQPRPGRGLFHVDNDRHQRGGHSIYVPEWVDDGTPMPLVVALHGGSGHGRDFVFSWLREARTRGCVVLAPTSPEQTWSFTGGEDTDAPWLFELVAQLRDELPIDPRRMLLTGMSDGGSYTLLTGLREESPFTALAAFSCMLSPEVMIDGRIHRARDLPVFLAHGLLDWMFPIDMARDAVTHLEGAGAKAEYREIEDLSHTYPRELNAEVLDWLGVPRPTLP